MSKVPTETSWLPELLSRLALASGVGYLAAAYTVSRWLTRPTPGRPQRTPSDLGLAWDPLECRTVDAYRLAGWVVAPPLPRATVALFHGVRQNRAETLDRIAFLVAAGYRCVAFDHRAHGESHGKRTSFGYWESRDVTAVLDLVYRRWPFQPRVALGISMGGAAICYAACGLRGLAAVILESVYHDIAGAVASRMGSAYPPWLRQLSQGVIWVTQRRLGLRLEQLAPVKHVAALSPTPILFLSGRDDPHVTPADTQRLAQSYPGPRELCLVPRAGPKEVCAAAGAAYQEHILDFLRRCL